MNKPYKYEEDQHKLAKERVKEYRELFGHVTAYVCVSTGLFFIDLITGDGLSWFFYPMIGWGIGLGIHAATVFFQPHVDRFAKRMEVQETSQGQWPKKDSTSLGFSTKLKENIGFDFSKVGKDILKAIRELEGNTIQELKDELGDLGLNMGNTKTESDHIPQKPNSAPAMPQGVAILMFTDIEAFTSYVERNGDEAGHSLLKLHNHIVRSSLKNNDGLEVKNLGDGFMLCFVSAKKALQCAAAVQSQLQIAEFPLKVRIGVHAGEPIQEDRDLTGQTVNLAARVMDQANGGQIFVTEVVKNLAGNLKGFQYADQGERRLPGLSETQKLYEFVPIEALTSPLDTEVDQQINTMENQLHQDT